MKQSIILCSLLIIVLSNYSETLGEKLCRLTVASYCKKAEVEKWSCTPCKNSPLALTNVRTFENSTMDTLGFIGTSAELNAIGKKSLIKCSSSEAPFPGISKTGSATSISLPSTIPTATTVILDLPRLQSSSRLLLRLSGDREASLGFSRRVHT